MRAATALAWLATLIYPLAIWLGLARFEPRWLGCVLLAVALLRAAVSRHPDLPPEGVRWVTNVTRAWCLFFVLNGGIALWTALAASDATWALYNGAIAYVLIGAMLGGEWLLRPRHAS